jgi:hypothetical protein
MITCDRDIAAAYVRKLQNGKMRPIPTKGQTRDFDKNTDKENVNVMKYAERIQNREPICLLYTRELSWNIMKIVLGYAREYENE